MQELAKGIQAGVIGQLNSAKDIGANQYAACRESAATIVANELKKHEREAAAWRWIDAAMVTHPPSDTEEAALWDLLCRARRERF